MDLDEIIHRDSVEMEIRDDLGRSFKDPAYIEFYGPDSVEQRRAYTKQRKALIEAGSDQDEVLDAQCRFMVEVTKSVRGIMLSDGKKKREATLKDMFNIYRGAVSVRAQAMIFVGNDSNFMKSAEQS
jgi:hypothetical protein